MRLSLSIVYLVIAAVLPLSLLIIVPPIQAQTQQNQTKLTNQNQTKIILELVELLKAETNKPGISLGDTAAIGALIASPLIFWIGYRRTKKTEDIKTVSDLVNKIENASKEIMVYIEEHPPPLSTSQMKIKLYGYDDM